MRSGNISIFKKTALIIGTCVLETIFSSFDEFFGKFCVKLGNLP
jgi:hypothetical protein